DAGLRIAVIENPKVGSYSPPLGRSTRVALPFPPAAAPVFAHANVLPTMIVDGATTDALVSAFVARTPAGRAFLVNEPPIRRTPVDPVATALGSNPAYLIVRHRAVVPPPNRAINVDLEERFNRQQNNGLYPREEFYTDRHITIRADRTFGHFGDYSIQGDYYRDGGGPANNVALHHIYMDGPLRSDLRIRHYVSAGHPDVRVMWFDALSQLVADLPALAALTPLNETPACDEYRVLHGAGIGAFPQLGKMKEIALRHHLALMTVVQ
ncbi:MAG TPA: sce7725 family protein, partial [Xanthomonadales bacterium]|nr:sce7725 family protein [Xanthomonadales bacterium]